MELEAAPFFNQTAANVVQFISFPLEVLGLVLILIELKDPALADQYEASLDQVAKDPFSPQAWMTLMPVVSLPLCVAFAAAWLAEYGFSGWSWVQAVLVGWLGGGVAALPVTMELGMLVRWAHRFSGGRALGAVGLLLAAVGTLGELYQVLVIVIAQQ